MHLNRREVLAWLFWSTIWNISIVNLPEKIFEIMKQWWFPVDFGGISDEIFRKQMKQVSWISIETIEAYLRERKNLGEICARIGQEILWDLWVSPQKDSRIFVLRKTPQLNHWNPTHILNRWWYPDMTWEDFFKWEWRFDIEGRYELEKWIQLPCSQEGVSASWNIELRFAPDGAIKLILSARKKALGLESGSSQWIEVIVKNAQDIQKQIFDWKTRDWSQEILEEHQAARERFQENMKKINEQERKKRETRNMNLLHSTTFLTPPEQTFADHQEMIKRITHTQEMIAAAVKSFLEYEQSHTLRWISFHRVPEKIPTFQDGIFPWGI